MLPYSLWLLHRALPREVFTVGVSINRPPCILAQHCAVRGQHHKLRDALHLSVYEHKGSHELE